MYPIEFFWRSVARVPSRPAIIAGAESLDYKTLGQRVYRFAQSILSRDRAPGSFVGLGADNSVEHVVALLGILAAGKVWVPLNPRNGDPELDRIIDFASPSLVLADDQMASRLGSTVSVRTLKEISAGPADAEVHLPMGPRPTLAVPLDHAQAVKFTGGTTGTPKGVLQSHRAWVTNIVTQINAFTLSEADRYLVAAPITHGTGTYVLPLLGSGGALIFPEESTPSGLLSAARSGHASMVFAPPTLIKAMTADQEGSGEELPSLRHLIYGGAPMRPDDIRAAQQVFGSVVCTSYGQTEAPQMITYLSPEKMIGDNLMSVGSPSLYTQVAILDDEGQPVPVGETAELCVRGDLVMSGYLHAPQETARAFRAGWLRTGDLASLDDRGFVYLRGRSREVIITGGFNVFPDDVEHVLARHPAIRDAVVLGVPDEKWGEAVHAVIQLRDSDAAVEPGELMAMVRRELGPVKTPKAVHTVDAFPCSSVGKVRKQDLIDDILAQRLEARHG